MSVPNLKVAVPFLILALPFSKTALTLFSPINTRRIGAAMPILAAAKGVPPQNQIKDAYPKMLLARTRHDKYNRDGIRIMDIARWLNAPTSAI